MLFLYVTHLTGRKEFNKWLKSSEKFKALDVLAWSNLRVKKLLGKDRNWEIQQSILYQLAYTKAEVEMKSKITTSVLPDETREMTLAQSISAYDELQESALFKWMPEAQSGPLMSSLSLLKQMKRGKLPKEKYTALTGSP